LLPSPATPVGRRANARRVDERQAYVGEPTMKTESARSMTAAFGRHTTLSTILTRWLTAGALLLALMPSPAHAQFGRLKKLKEKFSAPDSAARAKDSLAQIAAGVKPESVKVGKSFLQTSAGVVSSANGALESATGISAKDAALAATGISATSLMAKKLGVDPMSIGQQAMANARMTAQQRAMQKAAGKVGLGSPGTGGMDAAQMQAMQQGAMANAAAGGRANSAVANAYAAAGYSQEDIDALMTFQQEMTQLSMAASAGDPSAKSRLEAWERVSMKYQAEMQKLTLAAGSGDVAAAQKAQRMQFDMIKEWNASGHAHAKLPKGKKP
jgi:hypothetical protein